MTSAQACIEEDAELPALPENFQPLIPNNSRPATIGLQTREKFMAYFDDHLIQHEQE